MSNQWQTCINCGETMGRGRADAKYCSDRCRQSAHRRNTHHPEQMIETRSCAWCFRPFNARKSSTKKYCGRAACAQAAYRARHKAGRQVRF